MNSYNVILWDGVNIIVQSTDVYLAGLQALSDLARYHNDYGRVYQEIREIVLL